ncbi:cuticle-degrading protease [Fusarium langsethiae]|uniref:Cuticle-degrading protease n=1 Tax=Fusarium langsethiae TaxID=179993 RepID=A0A0M9EZD1_FUSLA|nr:cuticle-degrading protease [Fusarium langsethiae]GKU05319.1 unnamed protein product [Fusarium langsethiae]GKU18688.1 unnamed protein product [Fusarium langsethiae]
MSSIQVVGRNSEPTFVCNKIGEWWSFGNIRTGSELFHYENYLIGPSYKPEVEDEDEERPPKCPFSDFSKTVLQDQCLTIPVSNLEFEKPFLYHGFNAPGMISWCEGGECQLCGGGRELCPGCRDGREVMESFTTLPSTKVDCGTEMMYPLCIGVECAEESAYQTSDHWGDEDDKMSDEEYNEWYSRVMKKLGYM